jgi:hypothetical protein
VHIVEEFIRLDAVLHHETAQRRAVADVEVFLDRVCIGVADREQPGDKVPDPIVDLANQVRVRGLKRIVEVEHPRIDVGEVLGGDAVQSRGRWRHEHGSNPFTRCMQNRRMAKRRSGKQVPAARRVWRSILQAKA